MQRITFVSWGLPTISENGINSMISGCNAHSVPEPYSMWVCETLVDGLPLIAADAGGTAELIEDEVTGVLFSSGDVSDLTSKLLTLIENRRRLHLMRSAAYERGRHLFGVERFISKPTMRTPPRFPI